MSKEQFGDAFHQMVDKWFTINGKARLKLEEAFDGDNNRVFMVNVFVVDPTDHVEQLLAVGSGKDWHEAFENIKTYRRHS